MADTDPTTVGEESTAPKGVRNRRFRFPSNPWLPYIGDCKALDKYLNSKQGIVWLFPKYISALLRGISQVVFANNPLAGLVILIALLWAHVVIGLAAVVAATTAILTAALMRQDTTSISAGLTTFNAVLVGTLASSISIAQGEFLAVKLWGIIIVGAALSVFVMSAISNILSSLKTPLPALTLPFNIVIVLAFVCLMPKSPTNPVALGLSQEVQKNLSAIENPIHFLRDHSRQVRKAEDVSNIPTTDVHGSEGGVESNIERLNWGKILRGIILSSGQVFGVEDEIASVLIYVAILVYSPILFMMSGFGAILGTICGTLFTPPPYHAIYNGIWGYNGLLSASSIGGFFIVLTCHSFLNAMVNVVFTALIQQALMIAFASAKLPVFTLPFALSTLLFLSVTTAGNHLPRVETITFPEMHRYYYREASRVKREQRCRKTSSIVADEIADDKELVLTDVKVINESEGGDETKVQIETTNDNLEKDEDNQ